MKRQLQATVVKNAGSHFLLSPLPAWKPFPAVLRGKVRLEGSASTNPVAVGDEVLCEYDDEPSEKSPAIITRVLERRNHLVRRSTNLSRRSHVIAANLDRAVIVVTLYFPEIKQPFLDRILVSCEAYGVKPLIVLNKMDLYGSEAPDEVARFLDIYRQAGYRVIPASVRTGEGIESLRGECSSGLSLLTGESGVGKSSLVKALDPSLSPKVGELSAVHLQGCHTTSLYEMYPLSCGGFMIDTPGLRGFGLSGLEAAETASYFPEMLRLSGKCRFIPCTHTHEPGCAVKEALERGEISPERYNSYLGMLEEDGKFR
ncbi:MAG: ribosome small subunit-dependent GTPase A [Bacteroidales bacterium]|nr:ribosome small subunit-dependent GTPase A [Bacteroidales bacterium]